jgi:ferredoxin
MTIIQRPLRACFFWLEGWLDRIFPPAWNPLYHLGTLGFFYLWVVTVSGIYVYIFFDTGTTEAYDSIEYMTYEQWYLAGIMRSLHRYASDGMVLMMGVHMLREFALDRYRGKRWFTWVTGLPILWLVFIAGITGYWLVWDMLAQYVAQATSEWLDWLPIFGVPVVRNFLAPNLLDDRFFTLLTFIHIAVPLILLFILWIHLQRVSRPEVNPARGLAIGTLLMLLVLSLVKPAESQGPANLSQVPAEVGLDWFYLFAYPLMDIWSSGALWVFLTTLSLIVAALPWLPPMRRVPVARVDLANCNGCTRCAEDCPFSAVTMQPRSDGLPFEREAVVDPALCVACGICAGACPTSTPFRRAGENRPAGAVPRRSAHADRDGGGGAVGRCPSPGLRLRPRRRSRPAGIAGPCGPQAALYRGPAAGLHRLPHQPRPGRRRRAGGLPRGRMLLPLRRRVDAGADRAATRSLSEGARPARAAVHDLGRADRPRSRGTGPSRLCHQPGVAAAGSRANAAAGDAGKAADRGAVRPWLTSCAISGRRSSTAERRCCSPCSPMRRATSTSRRTRQR